MIGKIIAPPIIEKNEIIPIAVDNVNILYRKIRNSKIGFSSLSCLRIKKYSVIPPTISGAKTIRLIHEYASVPAILKPYNKPPNPKVDRIIDGISTLGKVCFVTLANIL